FSTFSPIVSCGSCRNQRSDGIRTVAPPAESTYLREFFRLGFHHVDIANEVKRLLGQVIKCARKDFLKALNCLFDRYVLSLQTSELSRHKERLRQEALHFAGTSHHEAVVFRKLVHTKNGDDVLKVLVLL